MLRKFIFLFAIMCCGFASQAQDLSGREFWFTMPENSGGASATNTYLLSLVSDYCADVTVEIPNLGWTTTVTLTPGLPMDVTLPNRTGGETVYHDVKNKIEGKGIHITADFPLVAYAVMFTSASTDAETILPMRMMGTEYVPSFMTAMRNGSNNYAYMTVVATEDNTDVVIETWDGTAPITVTVTLDEGETYMIEQNKSNCTGDLNTTYRCWSFSGSVIKGTKPIGVVCSTPCSDFPQCGACDGMMAMYTPVDEWGTRFTTAQVTKRKVVQSCGNYDGIADIIEITGPIGTNVAITNQTGTTNLVINNTIINGAPDYGFGTIIWNNLPYGGLTDPEAGGEGNTLIVSSEPVEVMQYSKAYGFDNTADTDPECIIVYPQKMWASEYLIGNPPTLTGAAFKAVVMVDNSLVPDPKAEFELDGAAVGNIDWQPFAGGAYSFRRLIFSGATTHTLQSPAGHKFGVYTSLVGAAESYATMGGMSPLIVNSCPDCPVADFSFTEPCVGTVSSFTDLSVDNNPGLSVVKWEWDFGDGSPVQTINVAPGDIDYTYTTPGIYDVTLTITNDGPDPCTISIVKKVRVLDSPTAEAGDDKAICDGDSIEIGGFPTGAGGVTPLTYNWTGGASTTSSDAKPLAHNSTSTQYKVRVTDFNGCYAEDSMQLSVTPSVDLNIIAGSTVCVGDIATVELTYNGTDPLDIVLRSDNNEQESFTGFTGGTIDLATTQTGKWFIKSATRNPAAGEKECININADSVDVIIKAIPTAVLVGDMTICSGTDSILYALINGAGGPYSLYFTDDAGNVSSVNAPADSGVFSLTGVTQTTIFTLDSVGYASGVFCPAYPNVSATVTVNPMPDAGKDVAIQLCNTLVDHDLLDELDNPSATDGSWTDVNSSGGLSGSILDTRNIPAGTYLFIYEIPGLAPCPIDSATVEVTINTTPKLTDILEICSADQTTYTVTANVVGGTNPSVSSGNGGISATRVLTSIPFATSTAYSITVTDAFGCGEDKIEGFKKCDCLTSAGSMVTDPPLQVCEGDSVIATPFYNNDFVDDGDDVIGYVLHDNSGRSLGTILDQQSVAEFQYPAGITLGTTYYVSPIAGNNDGNGEPDKTEDCFDVAAGLPVIFVKRPGATFGSDTAICSGSEAAIPVTLTGAQPFTLVHGPDSITGLNSTDFVRFSPTQDSSITFIEVFNNVCSNAINHTINITVNNAPEVNMHGGNVFCADDATATNGVLVDIDGDGTIFSVTYTITTDGVANGGNTIGNLGKGVDQVLNVGTLGEGENILTPTVISDNSGGLCPGITNGNATVNINPVPTGSLSISNPEICLGDSLELIFSVDPISDSYTINVQDGAGNNYTFTNVRNLESRFVTPALAGQYDFSISAFNSEQTLCDGTVTGGSTAVQVNPAPTVQINGAKQYCFGSDSVVLDFVFSGFPPFTMNFREDGANVFPNAISVSGDSTFVFHPPAGVHTYEVFELSDQSAGQCPGVGLNTATFTVNAIPTISFPTDLNICAGDSFAMDLNGTGNGPLSVNIVSTIGHDFKVSVDPLNPVVNDVILFDITDSTKFTITSIADNSTPNQCFGTSDDSLLIFVNPIPTLNLNLHPDNPELCFGDNAKFQFSLFGSGRAEVGYTHIESGEYDTKVILATSNPRNVTFSGFDVGWNHIRIDSIKSQEGAGCIATPLLMDSILVNPIPEGQLNLVDPEICAGDVAQLNINADGRFPVTIVVNDGIKDSAFTFNSTAGSTWNVTPTTTTQFRITQILDGSNPQCSNDSRDGDDQVSLDVNPLPTALIPDSTFNVCEGDQVIIFVQATGTGNKTVTFTNNFGFVDTVQFSGNTLSYIVNPSGIGVSQYTVANITDSKGCSNVGEGTVTIEVKPSPTVDFSGVDLSGCPPITPFFTNNSTGSYASCTWNFGDGNTSTGSCAGVSHVYNAPGTYTVTLELTTVEGCVASGRKENIVEVFTQPVADFSIGNQKPTIRNSVVNFTNTSKGGEFFLWDFAGLDQSSEKDPNFQFPFEDEGVYEVTLITSTMQGCADSTSRTISVEGVLNVSIPNSFTPDGDGKNDIFIPVINGHDPEFHDYEFNVFDRWGVPVFSTRDLIEGWDGTDNKGKIVKVDSYVYSVKVRSKYNSERKEFQGYVNIVR